MELGTMTGRNFAWPENYESSFIYQQYVGLTVNKISHFIVRCSSQEPSVDSLINFKLSKTREFFLWKKFIASVIQMGSWNKCLPHNEVK